jgi:hypothetical protein
MPLQKQVIFRVTARIDTFNGVDTITEVTLNEDAPPDKSIPIQVNFRQLAAGDAAQFPAGARVVIVVGADPAPAAAVEPAIVVATATVLDTLKSWIVGTPDPSA